jgi:hypothetical protein
MSDSVRLAPSELRELIFFANTHHVQKSSLVTFLCNRDLVISHADGGGIGTRTLVKCGCGVERDITDYTLW